MKNKLLITAIFVFAFAVVLHHYEKPVMAQVRAALVQNIDEPGRSPYTLEIDCDTSGNTITNICFGTSRTAVPANKRFVVQYVNGTVSISNGGLFADGFLFVNNGSTLYLDEHLVGNAGGFSTYTINMPVVAYFEAGQTPSGEIFGTAGNAPNAVVTLTGYLIDLTE
jgi:hypothetical protein